MELQVDPTPRIAMRGTLSRVRRARKRPLREWPRLRAPSQVREFPFSGRPRTVRRAPDRSGIETPPASRSERIDSCGHYRSSPAWVNPTPRIGRDRTIRAARRAGARTEPNAPANPSPPRAIPPLPQLWRSRVPQHPTAILLGRLTQRCAIADWICACPPDHEGVEEYSSNWKVEPGSPNT